MNRSAGLYQDVPTVLYVVGTHYEGVEGSDQLLFLSSRKEKVYQFPPPKKGNFGKMQREGGKEERPAVTPRITFRIKSGEKEISLAPSASIGASSESFLLSFS